MITQLARFVATNYETLEQGRRLIIQIYVCAVSDFVKEESANGQGLEGKTQI